MTSKILLITDPRSDIPIKNERNGFRAVAQGMGLSGKLLLINMPDTADIQVGDIFVSSGLGLRFPVGYPVGQVVRITKTETMHQDRQIMLMPMAHLDQAEQVLLSWPNAHFKAH